MLVYNTGDLLKSDCDIIMHQANCFSTMGAGIARQVKQQFPEAAKVDQECEWSPEERLGKYTVSMGDKIIFNLYSQYKFGGIDMNTDYNALYDSLSLALEKIVNYDKSLKIGMPYNMGCGLGGGSWAIVESIISHLSYKYDVTIHIYKLK